MEVLKYITHGKNAVSMALNDGMQKKHEGFLKNSPAIAVDASDITFGAGHGHDNVDTND